MIPALLFSAMQMNVSREAVPNTSTDSNANALNDEPRVLVQTKAEEDVPIYMTITPIGKIAMWSNDKGKHRLVDSVQLQKIQFSGIGGTQIYRVNNKYFEIVMMAKDSKIHATLFQDGGINLTCDGETYVAIDDEIIRAVMTVARTPSRQMTPRKGPNL